MFRRLETRYDTSVNAMRIGLTGGIAAGKSTVAARLRDLGACVIDYDALARAVVAPGGASLPLIVQTFGEAALNADGTLNRAWLAEHVLVHLPNRARANARCHRTPAHLP